MKHIFWVVPGKLCGRAGPNFEPWNEQELYDGGIRAVLSVNSAEAVSTQKLRDVGIDHACIPLTADAPPLPGDDKICRDRLVEQYAFVMAHLDNQRPVLVHCRHGKDRTGLFLAYFLQKHSGLSTEAAIDEVLRLRPIALSADGWRDLAHAVLNIEA